MESIKAPSPTALAAGTLVVIWTEVARRRASLWTGIKDSMDVLEQRRVIVDAQKAHTGLPAAPRPEPTPAEPRSTYERMRHASGVHFE